MEEEPMIDDNVCDCDDCRYVTRTGWFGWAAALAAVALGLLVWKVRR